MSTENLSAERAADELHSAIMNIPATTPHDLDKADGLVHAYRIGHRDARHAAAELVQARASSAAAVPSRNRETDRQLFFDPAFNRWLDEGISDAGHTVWDQIGDVCAAWHGWQNREFYATPAPPQAAVQADPVAFHIDPAAEPPYAQYARGVNDGFAIGFREGSLQAKLDSSPAEQPAAPPQAVPATDAVRAAAALDTEAKP